MKIRDIDSASEAEVALVADRMRATLVEVLGEARGRALYSTEWLRARVRWHLDASARVGRVLVVEREDGAIVGHAMARREADEGGVYGLFSTIFVAPEHRRSGVAVALMDAVEAWFASLGLARYAYATASHHQRLIAMFERRGYRITARTDEMVALTRE